MRGPEFLVAFCTPVVQLKNNLVEKLRENFLLCLPNNKYTDLPPHLKIILPSANREFIEWFVGFTDAEGTFSIVTQKNWSYVGLNFSIELHIDDVEILHEIVKKLGIGAVHIGKTRQSARFLVNIFEEINSVIIPIFNEFPLQTTKYLDFTSFKHAHAAVIKLAAKSIYRGRTSYNNFSKANLVKLKKLKEDMNSGRSILNLKQENLLRGKVSINKWWLLGFVEGEGTFGYKHMVPYFQIAQNQKNLFVLEAIESYFLYTLNLPKDKEALKYYFNKGTGVYSLVIYKVDVNFYYVLPFFESMTFISRKNIDYLYWVIAVIIHKLGYYYLPEGKKIALAISSATNKYRYTTNNSSKVELPNCELISKLLAQTPPFDISSGSHTELVKKFTLAKGGRKGFLVYIYESGVTSNGSPNKLKELKGSPFSTYGEGHVVLGLNRGSRVAGRYIDTGKKYKDKYIFSSIPLDLLEK